MDNFYPFLKDGSLEGIPNNVDPNCYNGWPLRYTIIKEDKLSKKSSKYLTLKMVMSPWLKEWNSYLDYINQYRNIN